MIPPPLPIQRDFLSRLPKSMVFESEKTINWGDANAKKKIEAAFMLQLGHGSVIVDAGAHLGDTVLTLAVHARGKKRIDLRFVALEPCPEKCDFIRTVVAANNLVGTVQVVCAAVGDSMGMVRPASNAKERATRDGSLRYEYCPNRNKSMEIDGHYKDSDAERVELENASNTAKEPVDNYDTESVGDTINKSIPIITLDSIFNQISPLGILHIDVEGWESNVLRGAKKTLTTIPEWNSTSSEKNDKHRFPCYVIAEAWTEKESLRRGALENAEEKIVRVMEDEINNSDGDASSYRFERIKDIVDIERNLVYVRKRKG